MLSSLYLLVIAVLFTIATADVTLQSVYTSKEDVSSSRTLFIAQFTLECKTCSENMNVYADVEGTSLAAGKSPDGKSYQISWAADHKNAPSGAYNVRLYDETGFANVKKAQRAGEDVSTIEPIALFVVSHGGVWKGAWVSSESVAAVVAAGLFYWAYGKKKALSA